MTSPPTLGPYQRIAIFAIVLIVTLYAGLNPKGFDFKNHVEVGVDAGAIEFRKFGVAFTEPIIDSVAAGNLNRNGFEISLTLGPETGKQEGFAFIAQIYAGDDRSQLVIGRWSDSVIVMNGSDYRNRFRHPRISAELSEDERRNGVEILIRSGSTGTAVEVQDRLVVRRSDVVLTIPGSSRSARIVLGNSVDRKQSWAGQIRRFGLYQPGEERVPIVAFDLSEIVSREVPNSGSAGGSLAIPEGNVVVERKALEWPIDHQFDLNDSFVRDAVINLFGFVPFGMALTGVLRMLGIGGRRCMILAVIAGFLVSLTIEYAQSWVPSRSSSALDLMLNVLGAWVGAILWLVVFRGVVENARGARPEDSSAN